MTKEILKQRLLSLSIFEDNKYLDFYCILILNNLETKKETFKTQRHHFIPVCYYKDLYNLKTRKEAEPYAEDDINNFKVNILYKEHIKSHYYLCRAVKTNVKLYHRFLVAFLNLVKRNPSNHSYTKKEDLDNIIDELDLDSYQALYEDWRGLQAIQQREALSGEKNVNYGKSLSAEKRKHLSDTIKRGYAEGKYVITPESEAKKVRRGSSNGMYGVTTIFITNGVINKRLDRDADIPKGWFRGFTYKEKRSNYIYEYDLEGNLTNKFENCKVAAELTGLHLKTIGRSCGKHLLVNRKVLYSYVYLSKEEYLEKFGHDGMTEFNANTVQEV